MTVPLVRGRRAGASVSGSPSAAAPAGTWTQDRAGCSLLEPTREAAPGRRSAARPAASLTWVNFGGHAGLLPLRFNLCKTAPWSLVSLGRLVWSGVPR